MYTRRRPSQWDVRDFPFGVPMPPPGIHAAVDRTALSPASAPPTPPPLPPATASRVVSDKPVDTAAVPVTAAAAVTAALPAHALTAPNPVVGPPHPARSGPLAGIDIFALRALLCPNGAQFPATESLTPRNEIPRESVAAQTPSAAPELQAAQLKNQLVAQPPLGSPQHATRHARRLYVGNLPVNTSDVEVGDFFNRALIHAKGVESSGNPVISVYLNLEKRFAFIELRSIREAAAALAMDGVLFRSMSLRMRRPNDYNEAACPPAPPPDGFDPSLLGIVSTQVGDGPNKVFIGGIPYSLNEDAIKELLQTYGRLGAFNLIKDPTTGLSKGFAFFEYADPSVVDVACASLSGTTISDKVLTVRRATQHGPQSGGAGAGSSAGASTIGGAPAAVSSTSGGLISSALQYANGGSTTPASLPGTSLVPQASRVLELRNVVTENELNDDDEYTEVVEDTEEEARRFGTLKKILVPRPGPENEPEVKGVGRVFLVFEKQEDAERAFAFMNGRKFEDRRVAAAYLPEEKFNSGDY
jgi:splicing factor U2AF 65 kDa subunit